MAGSTAILAPVVTTGSGRLTSWLSLAIIPFLVVAFAVLYPFPHDTARLFAWPVKPTIMPMILASVYLGGAYFFFRAATASQWHTVKGGFVPVGTFATLMGVATILHWDKFSHSHVAFWLWAGLYFTTPFLIFWVWWANRRHDVPATSADPLLPVRVSRVIAAAGRAVRADGHILVPVPRPGDSDLAMDADPADGAGAGRHLRTRDRRPGCPDRPPVEQRPDPVPGRRPDARAHLGSGRAGHRRA